MHSKIVFTEKGLTYKKDVKDLHDADENLQLKYNSTLNPNQRDVNGDPYKYRFSIRNSTMNLNELSPNKVEPMYFYKNTLAYISKNQSLGRIGGKKLKLDNPLTNLPKMGQTFTSFKTSNNILTADIGYKPDVLTMTQSSNIMKPFVYKSDVPEVVERMELKRSLYLIDKMKTFEKLKIRVYEREEQKNIRCDLSYGKDLEIGRKEFERLRSNFNNERKRYLERIHSLEKVKYQPIFKRLRKTKAKVYESI